MNTTDRTKETMPTDAELIEQARAWVRDSYGEGKWFNLMADRLEQLLAALADIREGRGPYRHDNHEFAVGVIENMKDIANRALAGTYERE